MSRRSLPSRNRNFSLYQSAKGRRLLRSKRLLESLEKDLLAHARAHGVRVEPQPRAERYRVTLNLEAPPVRYRRTSFLSEDELRHLRANPLLADLLGAASGRACEGTF